jgi:hypothetical protein
MTPVAASAAVVIAPVAAIVIIAEVPLALDHLS